MSRGLFHLLDELAEEFCAFGLAVVLGVVALAD